jgi:hypothetical protein
MEDLTPMSAFGGLLDLTLRKREISSAQQGSVCGPAMNALTPTEVTDRAERL